jgi:hypothetical protein
MFSFLKSFWPKSLRAFVTGVLALALTSQAGNILFAAALSGKRFSFVDICFIVSAVVVFIIFFILQIKDRQPEKPYSAVETLDNYFKSDQHKYGRNTAKSAYPEQPQEAHNPKNSDQSRHTPSS